jgi:titin
MFKQILVLIFGCSCYAGVTLQWDPNASDDKVTQYKVYRIRQSCGELVGVVPASVNQYLVDQVLNVGNPTTVFYVTALNTIGESFPSYYVSYTAEATPTPVPTQTPAPAVPAAPSNLTATLISCQGPGRQGRIDLRWVDNSSNETGFNLERSVDGSAYQVACITGSNLTGCSSYDTSSGSRWFRVKAVNASGNSEYSNVVQIDQPSCP